MSRAAWLNLALAAAVVALGAWAWLKPPKDAVVEYRLSPLKPAEARSIRIERAGAAAIHVEKKDEAWRLVAPFTARADETRVQRLLEIAGARSRHKLPAIDLGRFELDPPQTRVIVDGQVFGFGLVNAVTREQYVLAEGAVFAVHPRYGMALPAGPDEMASPQLLGPAETPVRIETKAFTAEQRDGKWTLTPAAKDPSQDDLLRWVEQWRLVSAGRVERRDQGKPLETIRIQLKQGTTLTFGVLGRDPELLLLREDEKLLYYIRADIAQRLFSPPGTGAPAKK